MKRTFDKYYPLYAGLIVCSSYFFTLANVKLGIFWLADHIVAINIANSFVNGGVFAADMFDNRGFPFFLFYSPFYYLYQLLFPTMEYYFLFMMPVLLLMYWLIAMLLYKICRFFTTPTVSIFCSFTGILYMALTQAGVYFNIHPLGLLVTLVLMYFILSHKDYPRAFIFFLFGLIIGIASLIALNLTLLALVIPFIAYWPIKKTFSWKKFTISNAAAFLGFILLWLILLSYFYSHKTLYALLEETVSNISGYTPHQNIAVRIIYTIIGLFGKVKTTSWVQDSLAYVFFPFFWWVFIVSCSAMIFSFFQRKPVFEQYKEKQLLCISLCLMASRFSLPYGYPSTNIYIIPVLFILPIVFFKVFPAVLQKVFLGSLVLLVGLGFFYNLRFAFYGYYMGGSVPRDFVYFSKKNIGIENVSVIPLPVSLPAYNTKWVIKSFYHKIGPRLKENISKYRPEIILDSLWGESLMNNEYSYLLEEYRSVPYLPTVFIRKDRYQYWDTAPPNEKDLEEILPFITLGQFIKNSGFMQ